MNPNPRAESLAIVHATWADIERLAALWRACALEEKPGDVAGADAAVKGFEEALSRYDFLRSDSFWMLAAEAEGRFVGFAAVARIPKSDSRVGFLYVDELMVLKAYRRKGAATALIEAVAALAKREGLKGIRLLVDPNNTAARGLYKKMGFAEKELLFCQKWLG